MFQPLGQFGALIVAQCTTYSVHSTSGPNCGILGAAGAIAYGLSQSGAICGELFKCNSDSWPFVQFPGGPAIALTQVGADKRGRAVDMNSEGVAVGTTDSDPLDFRYHNGVVAWLQPVAGGTHSEVEGINESGVAVGASGSSFLIATIWNGIAPTQLQLPVGPSAVGMDINESNAVCGWMGSSPYPEFGSSPFIWHAGVTTTLPLPAQAVNNSGAATALNNLGDACGYYFTYNEATKSYIHQGCAWIDGELIELGVLPGLAGTFPLDINDAREIVGYCTEESDVVIAPFLWRDGVMYDINDLVPPGSPIIEIARANNNRGQVTGQGFVPGPNGYGVAFLLTPALPAHAGDTNCDDAVNVNDLLSVINHWNPQGPVGGEPADLNRDNTIDHSDLLEVIFHWTQ